MKYPVPCLPREGESLTGLLSRIVTTNGYTDLATVAANFGINIGRNGISDTDMLLIANGKIDTKQVSELLDCTELRLKEASLNLPKVLPGSISDSHLSIHRWKICPKCMEEKGAHQRFWMLSFVTACPEHDLQLIDSCKSCSSSLSPTQPLTGYCPTCFKILSSQEASPCEISCSTTLLNSLFQYDHNEKENLEAILERLMVALYLSSSSSLRARHRYSPQLMSADNMRKVVNRIWQVAFNSKKLSNYNSSMRKQLQSQWPFLPNANILFEDKLQQFGIKIVDNYESSDSTTLIDTTDPWEIPSALAAKAAGISGFILRRLVRAGMIRFKLFSDNRQDSLFGATRLISLFDLHVLLAEIHSLSIPKDQSNGAVLVPLLNYDIAQSIQRIRNNKLSLYSDGSNTLQGLYIQYNETLTFEKRQLKPLGTISSGDATKFLNTYHAVIADLIQRSAIHLSPESTRRRHLIIKTSVEDFNKNYILIGAMAKQHHLNATNLCEKLAEMNVYPVSGPKIDGALVAIFSRDEISEIDFTKIKEMEHYSTQTGRKSTVNINEIQDPRIKKLILLVQKARSATLFAKQAKMSMGNLSMIMRGKKTFGKRAASNLAIRLDLDPDWFENISGE